MSDKLHSLLAARNESRGKQKPWVFWHKYWNTKVKGWAEGPYADRKRLMTKLCVKAEVRYFRYHALRHFGASLLETANVPIGSIQRILGHENRSTTEIYLHSIGTAEVDAVKVFDDQI